MLSYFQRHAVPLESIPCLNFSKPIEGRQKQVCPIAQSKTPGDKIEPNQSNVDSQNVNEQVSECSANAEKPVKTGESSEKLVKTGDSSEEPVKTGESSEQSVLTGEITETSVETCDSSEKPLNTGESSEELVKTGVNHGFPKGRFNRRHYPNPYKFVR